METKPSELPLLASLAKSRLSFPLEPKPVYCSESEISFIDGADRQLLATLTILTEARGDPTSDEPSDR